MFWIANDGTTLISDKPMIMCSDGKTYTYLGDKSGGPVIDDNGDVIADYVDNYFQAMWFVVGLYGGRAV